MLRGSYLATVDDKGRVKIPSDFLGELRKVGTKFYVTSATGEAAQVYPMRVWEGIEQKLAKASNFAAREKFLARTSYFGQVVEVDGQGRVLIPPVLREAAQMKGEVDVAGRLTYLEVWNHQRFLDKHINHNQITAEELGQLGI
jgi:transcriptional regulator MraZ